MIPLSNKKFVGALLYSKSCLKRIAVFEVGLLPLLLKDDDFTYKGKLKHKDALKWLKTIIDYKKKFDKMLVFS